MKGSSCRNAILLVIVLVFLPCILHARHLGKPRLLRHGHGHHKHEAAGISIRKEGMMKPIMNNNIHRKPDTLQIAGSSLPDCSHACGSCTPCRLVMVSFVCSSLEEAETCPMAYKCMCHSKSFPVP